jgi:hypothetical protein
MQAIININGIHNGVVISGNIQSPCTGYIFLLCITMHHPVLPIIILEFNGINISHTIYGIAGK